MRAALLLLAVLAVPAHADVQGVYGVGYTADFGTTYLPPTAHAGLATSISYRELAGKVGNWILFIGSAPAKPMPASKVEYSTECNGNYCTTYKTTTTTYPSQAEIDEWEKVANEWGATKGAAILRGEMGQELFIDVTSRNFGGNASGFKLQLFRPLASGVQIGQYALGYLKYYGVKSQKVTSENGVLRSMEVTGDHSYGYVGMPIRIAAPLGKTGAGMHLQFDNNILSLFFDRPSPIRLGAQYVLPHVLFTVEGVISGFRPDGYSINAAVTLAL